MTLTVKNWSEFQHYRDRKPAWIKLHRELLDNYEWHRLPDASRALAPMLWLLASESDDGTITGEVDEIAFRLRTSAEKVVAALNPLISAGFFLLEQSASAALATSEQTAISESEIEEQDKTEEETEKRVPIVSTLDEAVQAYNETAEQAGWAKVQRLTPARKSALKNRLLECDGLEGWQTAMAKAAASKFLTGKTPRTNGHANWRPDFDWFVTAGNFTKLMEGSYDDAPNSQHIPERGLGAALAALAD